MTLHWWMHWFWVTTLLIILFGSGNTEAAPQMEELHQISTDVNPDTPRPSERQGRAMYFTKTTLVPTTTKIPPAVINTTQRNEEEIPQNQKEPEHSLIGNETDTTNITAEIVHPSFQRTPINSTEDTNTTSLPEAPKNQTNLNMTSPITNQTEPKNVTLTTSKKRNLTRHPEVKDIDSSIVGVAESRIVTEKPLSLETTFLQTRIPPNIESSRRIIDQTGGSGMDTGEIAGISFAALVLAALAGSTAFVLYRRRYLNKPQTLNDKCSNPDSSGYLDDSTIRDNSEEMYSLDNDSFLNSLEAMTIQNYWTDTVKHTKL